MARQVGLEINSTGLRHSDGTWGTHLVSATSPCKRCAGTLKMGWVVSVEVLERLCGKRRVELLVRGEGRDQLGEGFINAGH